MKYCILIILSRDTISFRYYRNDGEDCFLPFDNGQSADLPLTISVKDNEFEFGNQGRNVNNVFSDIFETSKENLTFTFGGESMPVNKLLFSAIEYYIEKKFFQKVMFNSLGQLDNNRSKIPLLVLFKTSLNSDEKLFVKSQFVNAGYANATFCEYDAELTKFFRIQKVLNTEYAGCISIHGENVFLGIYDKGNRTVFHKKYDGIGENPAIKAAADKLWSSLPPNFLSKDNECAILEKTASDFIGSGETEFNDYIIFSTGDRLPAFVSLHEIENIRINENRFNIIADSLRDTDIANTTLILCGSTGADYFQKAMRKISFSKLLPFSNDDEDSFLDYLLKTLKDNDFVLSKTNPTETISPNKGQIGFKKREIEVFIKTKKFDIALAALNDFRKELQQLDCHDYDSFIDEKIRQCNAARKISESKPTTTANPKESTPPQKKSEPVVPKTPSREETTKTKRQIRELTAERKYAEALQLAENTLKYYPENTKDSNDIKELIEKIHNKIKNGKI